MELPNSTEDWHYAGAHKLVESGCALCALERIREVLASHRAQAWTAASIHFGVDSVEECAALAKLHDIKLVIANFSYYTKGINLNR